MDSLKRVTPLMLGTFFVAIASIIYELIIAGISSYLLGNSVYQFSITIGLFMTSMGIGALISKYIERDLITKFILIEIALGLIGGTVAMILFYTYANTNIYVLIMYLAILVIGILTGLELPLLTRVIKEYGEFKIILANVISIDYIGGLIGSVLFPLVLLPKFGFIKTSYIVGLLNLLVALVMLFKYREQIRFNKLIGAILILIMIILTIGSFNVKDIENYLEQRLYQDNVVYSNQSKYQKIVITKDREDIRLYLNGNIQFSSKDEYRYHEALVHPALSLTGAKSRILVLGGGDGLVVRELLKYNEIRQIDLVDLDKTVTDLAQESRYFLQVNNDSLNNRKVNIYNQDAYQYIVSNNEKYDLAIIDLPDPNNESLNKLYTVNFYNLIYQNLNDRGVMVVQSTSPYFAPRAFWSIYNTIQKAGFNTKPYHAYVPSFGDWGFTLATKNFKFSPHDIHIKVPTKFLSDEKVSALFEFGKDTMQFKSEGQVNTLINPSLIKEYYNAWKGY
ncbi:MULTISPECIES: polyamine aminopropyltransferase [unclassified Candidatus Frackibacter]|uniref:polyamine aminopropyltransferase n=1 Tax=unclassified Candidatus Frackibacter TaxID=2648818 RepID=UPI002100C900|nr:MULTISPECIES: polyamine aminopropyltransferase [unclassified Candidatus Frackibacter]